MKSYLPPPRQHEAQGIAHHEQPHLGVPGNRHHRRPFQQGVPLCRLGTTSGSDVDRFVFLLKLLPRHVVSRQRKHARSVSGAAISGGGYVSFFLIDRNMRSCAHSALLMTQGAR